MLTNRNAIKTVQWPHLLLSWSVSVSSGPIPDSDDSVQFVCRPDNLVYIGLYDVYGIRKWSKPTSLTTIAVLTISPLP